MTDPPPIFCNYSLLDSGEGEKLERFGEVTLARPSSLAIWRKRKEPRTWAQAHAFYRPSEGWRFKHKPFDSWIFPAGPVRLELRLQKNGQVGVFPDHALYLQDLLSQARRLSRPEGGRLRVLNLFAYTGMASALLAVQGAQVCHVDLSKQALSWAARNIELNLGESAPAARLICEDALQFVHRELRRKNCYDIVLADPPSFGRISKSKSWKFEEIAAGLISSCLQLIRGPHGAFFLTCHHSALGSEVLGNLLSDAAPKDASVSCSSLFLKEQDTERRLPAGHLAMLSF